VKPPNQNKEMKNPRTLKQLKQDQRVSDIEIDEGQDHKYWLYLEPPFYSGYTDTVTITANSVRDLCDSFNSEVTKGTFVQGNRILEIDGLI
tara:strand:+ start:38 stop:310 length:273 start_codon:yes stop_codon:yes gene_type:complete